MPTILIMQRNDWKLIIVYILKKKKFFKQYDHFKKNHWAKNIFLYHFLYKRLNLVMVDKRMTKDNITPQISNMTWNWKN